MEPTTFIQSSGVISARAALEHEWINMRDSSLDKKELNIEKLQESVIFARDRQDEQNRRVSDKVSRLCLVLSLEMLTWRCCGRLG
jgi:hypothetical protein